MFLMYNINNCGTNCVSPHTICSTSLSFSMWTNWHCISDSSWSSYGTKVRQLYTYWPILLTLTASKGFCG